MPGGGVASRQIARGRSVVGEGRRPSAVLRHSKFPRVWLPRAKYSNASPELITDADQLQPAQIETTAPPARQPATSPPSPALSATNVSTTSPNRLRRTSRSPAATKWTSIVVDAGACSVRFGRKISTYAQGERNAQIQGSPRTRTCACPPLHKSHEEVIRCEIGLTQIAERGLHSHEMLLGADPVPAVVVPSVIIASTTRGEIPFHDDSVGACVVEHAKVEGGVLWRRKGRAKCDELLPPREAGVEVLGQSGQEELHSARCNSQNSCLDSWTDRKSVV